MSDANRLAARFAHVHAQSTFVGAALLAAHGVHAGRFRPSDVRFFFYLFTNWLEHDLLRPGQDLDLTQVRRTLERLKDAAWLESADAPGERRYRLTPDGVVGLVETLADPRARGPFEERLFVISFGAAYRAMLGARLRATPEGDARAAQVEAALDPLRLLGASRAALAVVERDLDARIASGHAMQSAAREALAQGLGTTGAVARLDATDPYQLQHVRPMRELYAAFPDDLARFELERGIALRADLLFAPLAAQLRAQRAILDDLEDKLRTAAP